MVASNNRQQLITGKDCGIYVKILDNPQSVICVSIFLHMDIALYTARLLPRQNFRQTVKSWHNPYLPLKCKLWACCQIHKIMGCACIGNARNVFSPTRVSDPDMHHVTCVTHVSRCIPGSLISGFLWKRCPGILSWHFRRMHNPQFYVSGMRPMPHLSGVSGWTRSWGVENLLIIDGGTFWYSVVQM